MLIYIYALFSLNKELSIQLKQYEYYMNKTKKNQKNYEN